MREMQLAIEGGNQARAMHAPYDISFPLKEVYLPFNEEAQGNVQVPQVN